MSLEAYSRTKDGGTLLSPNFRVREFACRDGSDPVFIDSTLVDLLQRIRDHFGQPVTITSGYRTACHNAAVGGAAFSQHCYGRAPAASAATRKRRAAPAAGCTWTCARQRPAGQAERGWTAWRASCPPSLPGR